MRDRLMEVNFLAHDIRHCYMFLSTWNIALREEEE